MIRRFQPYVCCTACGCVYDSSTTSGRKLHRLCHLAYFTGLRLLDEEDDKLKLQGLMLLYEADYKTGHQPGSFSEYLCEHIDDYMHIPADLRKQLLAEYNLIANLSMERTS
jgi:hypothetical protein